MLVVSSVTSAVNARNREVDLRRWDRTGAIQSVPAITWSLFPDNCGQERPERNSVIECPVGI